MESLQLIIDLIELFSSITKGWALSRLIVTPSIYKYIFSQEKPQRKSKELYRVANSKAKLKEA